MEKPSPSSLAATKWTAVPVQFFSRHERIAGGRASTKPPTELPNRHALNVSVLESLLLNLLRGEVVGDETRQPQQAGDRDQTLETKRHIRIHHPGETGHREVAVPEVKQIMVHLGL